MVKAIKQNEDGKFVSPYREPRGKAFAVRLPKSLNDRFVAHLGDRPAAPVIEQAIREYLDRLES